MKKISETFAFKAIAGVLIACLAGALILVPSFRAYSNKMDTRNAETVETAEAVEAAADPAEETAAAETPAVNPGDAADAEELNAMLKAHVADYPADATVLTVNGEPVDWEQYYYMVCNTVTYMANYYGYYGATLNFPSCLTEVSGDVEMQDYIMESAASQAGYNALVITKAQEYGAEPDEEWIRAQIDATIEGTGGEEAYRELLDSVCLSEEGYRAILVSTSLEQGIFNSLYGEQCEKVTQEQLDDYIDANSLVRAKHILLTFTEETTDEDKAELHARMEGWLAELQAIDDPAAREARFDELMNENSEDPGTQTYPDGYVFGPGKMVAEFEDAAFALEDHALSDIVETSYGYHILLRLPLGPEAVIDYDSSTYEPITLRSAVAEELFNTLITEWVAETETVFAPEFENFKLAEMFAA